MRFSSLTRTGSVSRHNLHDAIGGPVKSPRDFSRRVVLLPLLLAVALVASADQGREFAAFYGVADVQDLGEDVSLTLKLRVYNYGSEDVTGATLTLEDSAEPAKIYGAFEGVSMPSRQSVLLSADLIIPRREYDRWQSGGGPRVFLEFRDAQGEPVRRTVEIIPALAEPEEED